MKQLTLVEKKVIYYKLCDLITTFDKPYNYCNIHKDSKGIVKCKSKHRDFDNYLCCKGCQYANSQTGCTTRSLSCKFYYCIIGFTPYERGLTEDRQLAKDRENFITAIRTVIKNLGIPYIGNRASFEDSI